VSITTQNSSVFVSRALVPTSPLLKFLQDHKVSFQAESLISFTPVSFNMPESPYLFFYSKTAIDTFLAHGKGDLQKYKYCFFGQATATHYEQITGSNAYYIGKVDPKIVQADIKRITQDEAITFMIGAQSLRSVQQNIGSKLQWKESIIYQQDLKEEVDLKNYSIAIISSPMNYQGFVKNGGQAKHYIAIGATTAQALTKHLSDDLISIAITPNEDGIVKTLSELMLHP